MCQRNFCCALKDWIRIQWFLFVHASNFSSSQTLINFFVWDISRAQCTATVWSHISRATPTAQKWQTGASIRASECRNIGESLSKWMPDLCPLGAGAPQAPQAPLMVCQGGQGEKGKVSREVQRSHGAGLMGPNDF